MHNHKYGEPHEHENEDLPHDHPMIELMRQVETNTHWPECRIPGCAWTGTPVPGNKMHEFIHAHNAEIQIHLQRTHGVSDEDLPITITWYPSRRMARAARWN